MSKGVKERMTAGIIDILKLVNMLASVPEETAAEMLRQYEADQGEASEAVKAVFQLADIMRKRKSHSGNCG